MYCSTCGKEIHNEAVVCVHCGCAVSNNFASTKKKDEPEKMMVIVVKVFLILGCLAQCWMLIPLAWCLPITIAIFDRLNDNKPISTGLKVCSLIFVSLIAGVCLLCMDEFNEI